MAQLRTGTLLSMAACFVLMGFVVSAESHAQAPTVVAAAFVHPPVFSQALPPAPEDLNGQDQGQSCLLQVLELFGAKRAVKK